MRPTVVGCGPVNAPNVYDAVAYPGRVHAQTHPDRLSTIAALFGLTSAPPERCRVLEVGCGDGRNLLGMATALPDSTFVGFDLASQPIAAGQGMVRSLGLKNLLLLRQDLMSVTADIGRFDYVIAHGFYAWVPAAVQDKLLALCREVLAPDGVAYVSYNAYPGCHLREMFREMMQFHVRGMDDPSTRIATAKTAMDFLRRNLAGAADYGAWVLGEMEKLGEQDPGTLFHDTLGAVYRPTSFLGFMDHAASHELQYLGEAEFLEMNEEPFSPEAVEKLRAFGPDRFLDKEQLMDFLKVRAFRQTLLCRKSIALRRSPASEDLSRFHVSTRARKGRTPAGTVEYRTPRGATMATDNPAFQDMMDRLEKVSPGSLPLTALSADPKVTAQLVVRLYGMAIVDLHPSAPRFVRTAGPTPAVSSLVRLQIERSPLVTNLLHADVHVEGALAKELVRLLDGNRTRRVLLQDLAKAGAPLSADALEGALQQLAQLTLLTQ